MIPKNKFDSFIEEADSTLWPIPGQAMNNKAVMYKTLPSIQSILQQPPDTDAMGIIDAVPSFGTPLEHVVEKGGDVFQSIQTVKAMFTAAKASPVYQGRDKQQKHLDDLIDRLDKMEKYFFKLVIQELDQLSLASLGNDTKME